MELSGNKLIWGNNPVFPLRNYETPQIMTQVTCLGFVFWTWELSNGKQVVTRSRVAFDLQVNQNNQKYSIAWENRERTVQVYVDFKWFELTAIIEWK
jgi:hypothetical protein